MGPVLCLLLLFLGGLHPNSLSRSKIEVDGRGVEQVLRVQALSLIEVLPLDRNDDLLLDAEEFEAGKASIRTYLSGCYDLRANGSSEPLERAIEELVLQVEGTGQHPNSIWIQATLRGMHSEPITSLQVEERLFDTSEPRHKEYVTVAWAGQAGAKHMFAYEDSIADFQPTDEEPRSLLRMFFELGVDHILTGYDHLLFLLALFVAVRGVRPLIWMVTAFTVAHSVTLAAAALDIVSLPGKFVELAIALSIVYVAVENLLGWTRRNLWLEALGFGLLHGLGFAGFLGEALAGEEELLVPLVGFNLGVEAGQFLAVLPLALIFGWRARKRSGEEERALLVPKRAGQALSLLIALAGSYWFLERAGFLPFE